MKAINPWSKNQPEYFNYEGKRVVFKFGDFKIIEVINAIDKNASQYDYVWNDVTISQRAGINKQMIVNLYLQNPPKDEGEAYHVYERPLKTYKKFTKVNETIEEPTLNEILDAYGIKTIRTKEKHKITGKDMVYLQKGPIIVPRGLDTFDYLDEIFGIDPIYKKLCEQVTFYPKHGL